MPIIPHPLYILTIANPNEISHIDIKAITTRNITSLAPLRPLINIRLNVLPNFTAISVIKIPAPIKITFSSVVNIKMNLCLHKTLFTLLIKKLFTL